MQTRSKSKDTSRNEESTNQRRLRSCRAMKIRSTTRTSSRIHQSLNPVVDPIDCASNVRNEPSSSQIKRKPPKPKLPSGFCNFCFTDTKDNYLLGDLTTFEDITAHKYCLYFSPGLAQNGDLRKRLWGFMADDVRKELRRGSQLKCSYCHLKGANVGCSIPECSITFHLPCGMNNGAYMHYHHEQNLYPSYCKNHRPKSIFPVFKDRKLCTICQENITYKQRENLLYIPCCHSYFHRECLTKMAYHHGESNSKCPNCNNVAEFVSTIKKNCIFLPDREPTYEQNLSMIVFRCNAIECRCQQGRDHNGDNEWELYSCDRCGSMAIHIACAGLEVNNSNNQWICDFCQDFHIDP